MGALDPKNRRNLALRVGSAVVLFPIAVWLTFVGGLPFAALAGVAAAVAASELVLMFGPIGAGEALGIAVAGAVPLMAAFGRSGDLLPGWAGLGMDLPKDAFLQWLGWQNSLAGILTGGGSLLLVAFVYHLLTKKEGMGGGDIKLLAMMGAFLGWKAVPFIIFASSLSGSVIGIALMVAQKKDTKLAIPFGPFLAFGAILYVFCGKEIISWYLYMQ